ncbi:hypothetical protein EYF80_004944 [Liparis tanakae]|uniref:Uncharacterized protein n=1 Tax=Liparis tanakae TaxID=230148 RepID=A0A4Z2J3V0_9TELE|nr:hypothetical protein EYF80_004944 [Liparis tanakae]
MVGEEEERREGERKRRGECFCVQFRIPGFSRHLIAMNLSSADDTMMAKSRREKEGPAEKDVRYEQADEDTGGQIELAVQRQWWIVIYEAILGEQASGSKCHPVGRRVPQRQQEKGCVRCGLRRTVSPGAHGTDTAAEA